MWPAWCDDEGHRAWAALTLGLAALVASPLLLPSPPLVDFPEHAATAATVLELWRGGPLSQTYALALGHTQYLLAPLLTAALGALTGVGLAQSLLLVLAVVAQAWVLRGLCGALGVDRRLVLLTLPLVWSRALTLGFVSFALACPLALGVLWLQAAAARRSTAPLQAALAVLTFYASLPAALFAAAASAALALAARQRLRRLAWSLALLLPAAHWALTSQVVAQAPTAWRWLVPKEFPRELPFWLGDVWQGDVDSALLVLWGVLAVAAAGLAVRSGQRPVREAAAVAAVAFALTFGLPYEIGWLWGLSTRLLPLACALLVLLWPPARSRARAAVALGAALLGVAVAGHAWVRGLAFAVEVEPALALLRAAPPGARLLQLNFDERSAVLREEGFHHLGAWHRVWNHGLNEPAFTTLPQSPVRYREGRAPALRAFGWEFQPLQYDEAREGDGYDVLLTRSAPPGFLAARWKPLRCEGAWCLWAR